MTYPLNRALELLAGESQGFAIDATHEGGSIAVKDTTTRANNHLISGVTTDFRNGLDSANNVRAGAVKLINSGTSPKTVLKADGTVGWAPHNLIPDFTHGHFEDWVIQTDVVVTDNNVIAPDGTMTASTVDWSAAADDKGIFNSSNAVVNGMGTASVWLKLPSGTGTCRLTEANGGAFSFTCNLTASWQRFEIAAEQTATKLWVRNISGQPEVVHMWGAQVNKGSVATPYVAIRESGTYVIGIPQTYDAVAEQYGILVEPAATNLCLQSAAIATSPWANESSTLTNNSSTAPDAQTTATKILDGGGGGVHVAYQDFSSLDQTSANYTFSAYLKDGDRQYAYLLCFRNGGSFGGYWVDVDLVNGTITDTGAGNGGTHVSSSITSVGNGWYRVTLTGRSGQDGSSSHRYRIGSADGGLAANQSYVATGKFIYAWGAQLELGTVATSYIPTLAATVTRATDDVYAALTNLPSYSSLSLHSQIKVLGYGTSGPAYITSLFKAAGHGQNDMQVYAQGAMYAETWSAGGNEATQSLGTITAGTLQRIGWRLATNNTNIFLDGVAGTNDPACAMPVTPDYIAFFNNAEAGRNGPVLHYDMALLPRAATDGELQWMTAGDTHLLASLLLDGENNGLACDFTESTGVGAVSVKDQNTPANILYNTAADNFWSNAGTSPKQIHHTSSPYVRWAPHNELARSQEFDNATWAKTGGATISANATAAPDGTSTADTMTNGTDDISQSNTLVAGRQYTSSIYLKAGTATWVRIIQQVSTDNNAGWFNASTGATGAVSNGGTGSGAAITATSVGSGWYRVQLTGIVSTSGTSGNVNLTCVTADSGSTRDNGMTLHMWGAQMNRGSIATTYLPTTSASRMGVPISYDAAEAQFGALVEPAGTNLCLRSEKFNTSPWAPYQATVTENAVTAPDGTTTASTLTGNANNDTHEDDQFGISIGTATYTASIYLKAGNNNYACFGNASDGNDYAAAIFDLTDGSVGTTASGAGGEYTFISASSVSVGSGWYRCILTYSHTGSVDNSIAIGLSNVKAATIGGGGQVIWTAANGKTIHMWGAQVETGSIATSYIPTLASTVTRAKDDLRVLTSTFKWDDTNDSIVFKWRPLVSTTGTDYNILSVRTDDSNRIHIYNPTSLNIRLGSVGGSAGTNTGSVNMVVGTAQAVGVGLATNDVANVVNGGAAETDSTFGIPAGLTTVYLGGDVNPLSTATMYAYSLIIVPRRMSDTELQARTT